MLGKGHHNVLEQGHGEETVDIGGLLCTPDEIVAACDDFGIGGIDGLPTIVEYKTTRKSAKKTPFTGDRNGNNDLGNYIDQLGGYCAKTGIPRGRLHVFYLLGYWGAMIDGVKDKYFPVHKCWDFEFEPLEMAAWSNELDRRRGMVERAEKLTDIPLYEHRDWECGYCALKSGGVCPGGSGEWPDAFQVKYV